MSQLILKPSYKGPLITSPQALSSRLEVNLADLQYVASNASNYYETWYKSKEDGSFRKINPLKKPLDEIQEKINRNIFDFVTYPSFIKDCRGSSYVANISEHANDSPKMLFFADISNFFPSIRGYHVESIWEEFFCFDKESSRLLTLLTTLHDCVPQGAKTSSNLGHLVLREREGDFVLWLQGFGVFYTRYADDIAMTCTSLLTKKELGEITKRLHYMLNRSGFRAKRKLTKDKHGNPKKRKYGIVHSGLPMPIHKVNINSGRGTIPKLERNKLRLMIFNFKKTWLDIPPNEKFYKELNSLKGKVSSIENFHPALAEKYLIDLRQLELNKTSSLLH